MKQERISGRKHPANSHKRGTRQDDGTTEETDTVPASAGEAETVQAIQSDSDPKKGAVAASRRLIEGQTRTFNFNGRPIRSKQDGEATWFVAADVCDELDHTNSRMAVGRLDEDERGVTTIYTPGGDQEMTVVSESGLYALILTSRKPQAKAFRRWVTGEVLPTIRKTGRYARAGSEADWHRDERGKVTVVLPSDGCFVVAMHAHGAPYVQETGYYDGTWRQVDATDCRILCNALRTIEAFWLKVRLLKACGVDPEDGFALEKLEEAIRQGGALAQRYLRIYDEYRDKTLPGDGGTPSARRH